VHPFFPSPTGMATDTLQIPRLDALLWSHVLTMAIGSDVTGARPQECSTNGPHPDRGSQVRDPPRSLLPIEPQPAHRTQRIPADLNESSSVLLPDGPNRWSSLSPGTSCQEAAAPHPVATASTCCCDRLCRNNLSRLCVAAIRCHSPFTFSRPRSRNRRRPRPSLICPFTGSTITLRRA
jgi:hypothetical protein